MFELQRFRARVMLPGLLAWMLLFLFTSSPVAGQSAADKQPLDHSVYDIWNTIGQRAIAPEGDWLLYVLGPENVDDTLRVRSTDRAQTYTVPRGGSAQFTRDGAYVVSIISPPVDSARVADHEGRDAPPDTLAILDLASGDLTKIERVKSYRLPEEAGGYLAYLLDPADDEEDEEGEEENGENGDGDPLVLRNLETGAEQTFRNVASYRFTPEGDYLVYATEAGDNSGVFTVDPASGEATALLTGEGEYTNLTFDESGEQGAFLTNRDHEDEASYTLYRWQLGSAQANPVAQAGDAGLPDDYVVSEYGNVSFSEDGTRLFFGTAPRERLPDDLPGEEEDEDYEYDVEAEVDVQVWHWDDPRIQTVQENQLRREQRRTYQAVAHLDGSQARLVQLAREDIPNVNVGNQGDADVAVGISNLPYEKRSQWSSPSYYDAYLIDVQTGEARQILEEEQAYPSLSPEANYVTWWDRAEQAWYGQSVEPGSTPVNLSAGVPHPLYDELHDRPFPAGSYGSAGWTEGDERFLIYDRYDIWALDPAGEQAPENLTDGFGRNEDLRLRYVRLDSDERAIDPDEPLLLSAFNLETKNDGFYRLHLGQQPQELVYMERRFGSPNKAEDADVLYFTRQSFQEFPDLWVSDLDFSNMERISHANPQQDEYRWGTAELEEWESLDGERLQGILYKPEGFDESQEYPMMVYFYERRSNNLHSHYAPEPHRSTINISFYVSRGYVVFVPDIVYREGYPGESAYNSVMPGVMMVAARDYIDEDRVGVQGHSWGGYQIAYMVTKTDFFAAAEAGAPVANMTSAYGGIRWSSGRSRQFQYENTQSRIGGTLWEYPMRYIENSPLFFADKINTPLLILHNDEDGAVPYEQGLELFLAMRRLEKPTWLINYRGEPHWPTTFPNKRDWAVRMQQFFDYYLMDEPAPVWMAEGVPALQEGDTLGYEPAEEPVETGQPVTDQH